MRKPSRMPLRSLWLALVLAPLSAACSDDSSDKANPPSESGADDVVFAGGTTDEALEQLLDRTAKDVAAERLVIDSPEADAVLNASEPALLAFHGGSTSRGVRPLHYTAPSWKDRAWTDLKQLFGPERAAHAHGTPYSDTAYFLVIDDAKGASGLRVFTGETSYEVDSATWSALAEVPQPLTLTIVSAFFEENDIPADGGPFVGADVQFSIE